MGYLRPKIVFDTQLVSNAASGTISSADWKCALARISNGLRYAVSLNTLYELTAGLAGSSDEHFKWHQRRFSYLFQPGAAFLPTVGDYVRQKLFALPLRMRHFSPPQVTRWVRVILAANNRDSLTSGLVTLPAAGSSGKSYGVDFTLLKRQIAEGKSAHASRLEELRAGDLVRSTPNRWAESVLSLIGVAVTEERRLRIIEHLDAAFKYEVSLWDMAKSNLYDFSRHDSDWIDSQQLLYLCDPLLFFVTGDGPLKRRIARSSQSNRVLLFDDFVRSGIGQHMRQSS